MDRATLQETLDSVSNQTHRPIEIIMVNAKGGAHQSEQDKGGAFSFRVVNQGGLPLSRAEAANAGLDVARGQYIAFLDDDDTLDPDHLSHLLPLMQTSETATVAYAGVRCVDRSDPDLKITRIFGEPLHSFAQLLAGNFIPIHAPLFPSQLRQQARYDETLEAYEDWDFWLQLAQSATFVYSHSVTATYFTGGTSGVSPQAPDWEAVRRASRNLYAKWMRIKPDEFRNISNLYHEATAKLKSSQEEVARLQLSLAQSQIAAEHMQPKLDYTSFIGTLCRLLRQLKTFANQLFNR